MSLIMNFYVCVPDTIFIFIYFSEYLSMMAMYILGKDQKICILTLKQHNINDRWCMNSRTATDTCKKHFS